MNVFVETERCMLREILLSDVEGVFQLDSDPDVHKYLGNKPIKDREQAIERIKFIRQ